MALVAQALGATLNRASWSPVTVFQFAIAVSLEIIITAAVFTVLPKIDLWVSGYFSSLAAVFRSRHIPFSIFCGPLVHIAVHRLVQHHRDHVCVQFQTRVWRKGSCANLGLYLRRVSGRSGPSGECHSERKPGPCKTGADPGIWRNGAIYTTAPADKPV